MAYLALPRACIDRPLLYSWCQQVAPAVAILDYCNHRAKKSNREYQADSPASTRRRAASSIWSRKFWGHARNIPGRTVPFLIVLALHKKRLLQFWGTQKAVVPPATRTIKRTRPNHCCSYIARSGRSVFKSPPYRTHRAKRHRRAGRKAASCGYRHDLPFSALRTARQN